MLLQLFFFLAELIKKFIPSLWMGSALFRQLEVVCLTPLSTATVWQGRLIFKGVATTAMSSSSVKATVRGGSVLATDKSARLEMVVASVLILGV